MIGSLFSGCRFLLPCTKGTFSYNISNELGNWLLDPSSGISPRVPMLRGEIRVMLFAVCQSRLALSARVGGCYEFYSMWPAGDGPNHGG